MAKLPAGFEDLEEFVAYWDVPTSHDRWMRRSGAEYPEIVRFYEAMLPRVEAATSYCEQYPLDAMPEDAASLLRLILALMQASIAVELHGQARAPASPWPHSLRIDAGMQPFG
jgi:hypothetical protein